MAANTNLFSNKVTNKLFDASIGKCDLPLDGNSSVPSVQESDFNGVISIMLNCQHFQTCMSPSCLSPPPPDKQCALEKVRQIGRDVRHTSECKITDSDLQGYCKTFSTLLVDPIGLQHDPSAKMACMKLVDLQTDRMSIKELGDLLKEADRTLNLAKEWFERFTKEAEMTLSNAEDATCMLEEQRIEKKTIVGEHRLESKTQIGDTRIKMKTKTGEEGIQIMEQIAETRMESKMQLVEELIESNESKIQLVETRLESIQDGIQRIENNMQSVIVSMKQAANETSLADYTRGKAELRPKVEKCAQDNWEIAKCYLPLDEYSSFSSVQESDFNGVISIMLNCQHFQTCLSPSCISPPPPDKQCALEKLQNDRMSIKELVDLLNEADRTLILAKEGFERFTKEADMTMPYAQDATFMLEEQCLERKTIVGEHRLESKTQIGETRIKMKTKTGEGGIQIMEQIAETRMESKMQLVEERIESNESTIQVVETRLESIQDGIQRIENTMLSVVVSMKQAANETSQADYKRREAELTPKKECTHAEVKHEIKKIGKHIHDGRLVKLSPAYIEHVKDCLSDPGSVEKGGYGTVYITREQVDGFRQRIVLKELSVDDSPGSRRKDKVHILASVANEKLASRVMHFAIVPLIAYHDDLEKGKYYFIAPYLAKGDLYTAIQSDRTLLVKSAPPADYIPVLDWKHRLKIMYQIACAIDYLHTGNSFRGTILHMDIKSKNVVIDSELNARLIDFGLAREVKEGVDLQTATPVYGTEGYFPTVQHKRLTPEHDYHNFGIVIRELLTGVDPTEYEKDDAIQLRKWDSRRVENNIQDRVWPKEFKERRKIRTLSDTCIDSVKKEGTLKSKSICGELKNIMRTNSVSTWTGSTDKRCEICMVNEHDAKSLSTSLSSNGSYQKKQFAPVAEINHKNCPSKIKICHACMRNSYFNPIKCHTCDNDIKAVIGDGWGAVLIAGYDKHDANLFKKDVTAFGDAITSTILPTMCINKSNLVVVDFNTKSEESASSRIEKAFKILESKHVHTLVFLYSGHNCNLGFQIGRTSSPNERSEHLFYDIDKLCKCIKEFNGLEKVIVFLDCCYAKPLNVPDHICLIQFNATGPNDKTEVVSAKGSIFTRYLVQAFTMKASGEKCKLRDCDCSITGDFITLGSLWDYILRHSQHGGMEKMIPYQNTKNVRWDTIFLAYNYNFKVKLCFDVRVPDANINQMIEVLPRQLTEFRAFKPDILFPACFDMLTKQMNIQASVRPDMSKYAEILVIEVDGGPKQTQEIDNMEKLLLAWNAKLLFRCRFRQCTEIDQGRPVGFVLKNGNIVCNILSRLNPEQHPLDIDGLEELMTAFYTEEDNIKHTELVKPLKLFNDKLSALLHAAKDNKLKNRKLTINCNYVFEDGSVMLVYMELTSPEEQLDN